MSATETGVLVAVIYGLLKAIEMLIKALVEKRNGKPQPAYKHDFMEQLTHMFAQLTESLKSIGDDVNQIKTPIIAVDQSTNWPRVWTDSPQSKRTHDNVSTLVDTTHELTKLVTETHELVKKKGL